jgi:cAMP-specific phosphodiesterase 4
MVLGTDMGKHSPLLTTVHAKLLDRYDASIGVGSRYDALTSGQEHIMLQLFLKSADLGHSALPIRGHMELVHPTQDEFFRHGDAERARGLPLSPLADTTNEMK